MKINRQKLNKICDVVVIGSGVGSLTAACLLAKDGANVTVVERNLLPGGCVSSYYRKGYVFEAGATTLVGLDEDMPLRYLLDETGIEIKTRLLEVPMQVHLSTGETLTRYHDMEAWIAEAERVFGKQGQRAFWEYCYRVSRFVWSASLRYLSFPPSNMRDLFPMIKNFKLRDLPHVPSAFVSMKKMLAKYDLLQNKKFVDFVNEQLLITAQNRIEEVNVLFGATALCYTNYGNYYVEGGLINLVRPLCEYIENQGGTILHRTEVNAIQQANGQYQIKATYRNEAIELNAPKIVSGIPLNNTLDLWKAGKTRRKSLLKSDELVSAFSMGIGYKSHRDFDCIHHQIHINEGLPIIGGDSIFISLNHPTDTTRAPEGMSVMSVSTHIFHPEKNYHFDKEKVAAAVVNLLVERGFLLQENIAYTHASTPRAWEAWTGRKYGFVGGYPQYLRIKPWQLNDARLAKDAYICGDTTYPGQGIPGACLSGIVAYKKMKLDGIREDEKNNLPV